ncbi:MAG: carbamoyl-phosphate synthase large subunit, partial [Gammaproteobacteria bacterium]|nr:carbamoyl-phosphate synthase large subunit [Gammaproteobacteria bacterium]
MSFKGILIANRGEIAIRVSRAVSDLGMRSVAVFSEDDKESLHAVMADDLFELSGIGATPYLDMEQIIGAAKKSGCDAIHPGYGFLSEQYEFAQMCQREGISFIGPRPEHLQLFGDKGAARDAAVNAGVPVLRGINRSVSLAEALEFFDSVEGGIVVKAVSGGGGRGTRIVSLARDLPEAFSRCQSEAEASFGNGDVYVEEFLDRARHIEIQIVGDRSGNVVSLGERECSAQRRNQKVIEIAPAPGLSDSLRAEMISASVGLAEKQGYENLGTFEFLVTESTTKPEFFFIETNARLQVEHTVTEEVTGIDLVRSQIQIACGSELDELGLDHSSPIEPRGFSIQARVNLENINSDGSVVPCSGILSAYEVPSGPGTRTDGFGYVGYRTSTRFDSLLAKVVVHSPSPDFKDAVKKAQRVLSEFRIGGVGNNLPFLKNIISHPDFVNARVHSRWIDENSHDLAREWKGDDRFIALSNNPDEVDGYAGARVDSSDPMALFKYDQEVKAELEEKQSDRNTGEPASPDGFLGVFSSIQGTIVSIDVQVDQEVTKGQTLAIVEAMKMEHLVTSTCDGIVRKVTMKEGDVVREGHAIVFVEEAVISAREQRQNEEYDPDFIRSDLQENIDRHAYTLDENRPLAVEKRRARGGRMPRENIAQLMDAGSFKEYWPLLVARQHKRYDIDTLRRDTPADGVVAGTGTINADLFDEESSRAMVVHYDYTVLAGTQGGRNHYKQDRMFELALRYRLPVVLFGEGGGGRPGDDSTGPSVAFDTHTFSRFSKLSGAVPLVGVNHGRCFAGNTALLACCDVIIATKDSTIAMGGPAMIEGGGLGVYTPEEVGPMAFQVPNGVVDIMVENEEEAVRVAKKYLSYFQGATESASAPD